MAMEPYLAMTAGEIRGASVLPRRTGWLSCHFSPSGAGLSNLPVALPPGSLLILDDSTSAVDTATDAKIRKAFAEEIPGTTKLIIAQRISSVQSADRIIVLDEGKINGFGTHEELLANNSIYRDVYESQTGGGGDFDENGGAQ